MKCSPVNHSKKKKSPTLTKMKHVIRERLLTETEAKAYQAKLNQEACCERDHNEDGNCDIHKAPGVFRRDPALAYLLAFWKEKVPKVREDFVYTVAALPIQELQRRLLVQADWMRVYHEALDGIKEIRCMPGAGIDKCRQADEFRAIVQTLVNHCPLTWEKDYRGVEKKKS